MVAEAGGEAAAGAESAGSENEGCSMDLNLDEEDGANRTGFAVSVGDEALPGLEVGEVANNVGVSIDGLIVDLDEVTGFGGVSAAGTPVFFEVRALSLASLSRSNGSELEGPGRPGLAVAKDVVGLDTVETGVLMCPTTRGGAGCLCCSTSERGACLIWEALFFR